MRALIIGVDGQDGVYLTDYLLQKEYEVYGVLRKKTASNQQLKFEDHPNYHQMYADLTDTVSLLNVIRTSGAQEIYNFGGQSNIPLSWQQPLLTAEVNALGVVRLLEAVRIVDPSIRFFQASSSEIFDDYETKPLDEKSPLHPRNPYGMAKLYAHCAIEDYRQKYGLYACAGILFNHESPYRGTEFVTRKISVAASEISRGREEPLKLGDLGSVRDWGFAGDYVKAMHLMLQQEKPKDYVIATGIPHTVKDLANEAFKAAGITLRWEGKGLDEIARNAETGKVCIEIDPTLCRGKARDCLIGDPGAIRRELGFVAEKSFEEVVAMMVSHDMDRLR